MVVKGLSVLLISHFTLKVTQTEHFLGSKAEEWLLLARVVRAVGNVNGCAPIMDPIIVSSRLTDMMQGTRVCTFILGIS